MLILSKRIKNKRLEKGLTQQELGNKIGVSKVSISCYENMVRKPSLETLKLIADALETTVDYLIGQESLVVCEDDDIKNIYLSKDEINIIMKLKQYPKVYNALIDNTDNTLKRINKIM